MAHKKAQIAVELIILMVAAFLICIGLILASYSRTVDQYKEREELELEDISHKLRSEVYLAVNAKDGYSRVFTLPDTALSHPVNYSLTDNNTISIATDNFEINVLIPFVEGTIRNGTNKICRISNSVYIQTGGCTA